MMEFAYRQVGGLTAVFIAVLLLAAATAVLGQDQDSKFKDWIDKLGDSDFELREKAQEALIQIGEPAIPALKAAMKSGDAEVARASCIGDRLPIRRPGGGVLDADGRGDLDRISELGYVELRRRV